MSFRERQGGEGRQGRQGDKGTRRQGDKGTRGQGGKGARETRGENLASDASKTPETAKDGVTPQTHNPPTHSPVTCAKLANRTTVRSRSRKEPNFATCNSEA